MSQLYPDLTTNWPNTLDPNRVFVDVSESNKPYVDQYMTAINNGNFEAARNLMFEHTDLKNIIINASIIQLVYDQNIAQQRFFSNSLLSSLSNIVQYKGEYSSSASYVLFNIVSYSGKAYMCIKSNCPIGTLPSNTTYWTVMTLQGISGTGMAFHTSWDSSTPYKIQDCVPYSNKLYVCIADNTNQKPSTATSYWAPIITITKQIIWSVSQPSNQDNGDIWYEPIVEHGCILHVYDGAGNYGIKYPKSQARYIDTLDGSTVQDFISSKGNAGGIASIDGDGKLIQDTKTLNGYTYNYFLPSYSQSAPSTTLSENMQWQVYE